MPQIPGLFWAQSANAAELLKARKQVSRSVNLALRKGDVASERMHTKLYALIFCAWAEANFLKVVLTPRGFHSSAIEQIKRVQKKNGIGSGWKKCLELGLGRVRSSGNSSFIPNARLRVSRIIDEYVVSPSQIRNKIAHGQWLHALNGNNSAVNEDLTSMLNQLDIVKVDLWFDAHSCLANIMESLIESPARTFPRDYWIHLTKMEEMLLQRKTWTREKKLEKLKKKTANIRSLEASR